MDSEKSERSQPWCPVTKVKDRAGTGATNPILEQLLVGKGERGCFRHSGKVFHRRENVGMHVTAQDNAEGRQLLDYD